MQLRRFVPVAMCAASPERILGSKVAGLALVAKRPIQDEEIFLDYRLSPLHPQPAWYTPVDKLAESRRWG